MSTGDQDPYLGVRYNELRRLLIGSRGNPLPAQPTEPELVRLKIAARNAIVKAMDDSEAQHPGTPSTDPDSAYRGQVGQYLDDPVKFIEPKDNWADRSTLACQTCMWFVSKPPDSKSIGPRPLGRCRRRSPELGGWPVVYTTDFCGDHKLA